MPQEMATETLEVITMAVDKFLNNKNYEVSLTFTFVEAPRRLM